MFHSTVFFALFAATLLLDWNRGGRFHDKFELLNFVSKHARFAIVYHNGHHKFRETCL